MTANPLVYCDECEFCARDLNQLCVNRNLIGKDDRHTFNDVYGTNFILSDSRSDG